MDIVYSFDVFDTVLTRLLIDPRDVFNYMQHRITRLPDPLPKSVRSRFWDLRVWAEFRARRRASLPDVTLEEIYAVFVDEFGLSLEQATRLKLLELEVERSVLVPAGGVADLLQARRRQAGRGIIFISDMYLPADFIVSILHEHQLFQDGDRLYVSGEAGATKGSGRLFHRVLADFSLQPSELVHLGDNPWSDFVVPKRLGIGVVEAGQRLDWRSSRFGALLGKFVYALHIAGVCFRLKANANI